MKSKRDAPAVTSLPQSPQVEGDRRVRRYAITMTIRVVCFALMVFVQPYGWYTWIFASAAALLPYVAVVFANAGSDSNETKAESPMLEVEAPRIVAEPVDDSSGPQIFRITENRRDDA